MGTGCLRLHGVDGGVLFVVVVRVVTLVINIIVVVVGSRIVAADRFSKRDAGKFMVYDSCKLRQIMLCWDPGVRPCVDFMNESHLFIKDDVTPFVLLTFDHKS